MNKDEIRNAFDSCRTKKELCQKLGIDDLYQSGTRVTEQIYAIAQTVGIDYEKNFFKNKFRSEKFYCLNCGKEIKRGKKFCNNSCAAIYNNKKRLHSNETKQKISESVRKYHQEHFQKRIERKPVQKEIKIKTVTRKRKQSSLKIIKEECIKQGRFRECCICGNIFEIKFLKRGWSKSTTCSPECHHELRKLRGEQNYEKVLSEGRFQGWKSRNVTSYSERFWKDVLDNNDIDYIREYVVEVDKTHRYFLDFLIEINGVKIDLEIDGKQHTYSDRIENDVKRDAFLTSNGFQVYRIAWNEIVSEQGSLQMREKINSFLKYLETIK